MADQKYASVVNFMKSKNLHFSVDWLKGCVEYFLDDNFSLQDQQLYENVMAQWILCDLREAGVPALPPGLAEKAKVELPGQYAVQVETILDSGKPRYMQLQDIRKNKQWENVKATMQKNDQDNSIPEKRCLTMTVTDGVQTLQAMEYGVIPELRLNDPDQLPGFKMLIIGPVLCRGGMIMLARRNVSVLGGEVASLVQPNSYEPLLMRVLGIDGEPQGAIEVDNNTVFPEPQLNSHMEVQSVPNRVQNMEDEMETMFDDDDDALMGVCLEPINSRMDQRNGQEHVSTNNAFEDEFDITDIPATEDMSYQSTKPTMKRPLEETNTRGNKFPKAGPSSSVGGRAYIRIDERTGPSHAAANSREPEIVCEQALARPVKPTVQSSLSRYLVSSQPTPKNSPCVTVSHEPFVYLSQICDIDLPSDKMFRVKAQILTLKTKIKIKDDELDLVACISDGSLSVDVSFSSDVLEHIMDYSPSELSVMLRKRKENPLMGIKYQQAFVGASQKLITLNCIFCIKFFRDKSMPRVIDLEEVSLSHLNQLSLRKK